VRQREREPHGLPLRRVTRDPPAVREHLHDTQPASTEIVGSGKLKLWRAAAKVLHLDTDLSVGAFDDELKPALHMADAVRGQLGDHQLRRLDHVRPTAGQYLLGEPTSLGD